jgi:hypothetical protein
MPEVVGW